jgi:iron(III) transport system substrate-binding protein
MIQKSILLIVVIFITTISTLKASNDVNIYSHRHYTVDKKLYEVFTKKTGINVNLIKASSAQLINRIQREGKYTKADVLISTDVGMLELAKNKGIFQSINSQFLNTTIPKQLKDKDNLWFALTKRARIIAYNTDKVKENELSTYLQLMNKKWKNKIVITKSSEVYNQSLLSSILLNKGEPQAKEWARAIKSNMARKPSGTDKDSLRAIAAGLGDIAIVNTYYIGQMMRGKSYSDKATSEYIGVFFPNQGKDESGTHINISGAGVIKYSKNKQNAIKLIEFLASIEAQELFAKVNFEYPVNPNAKVSKLLESWGPFKEDPTSLSNIGSKNKQAVKLFHKIGWNK